MEVKKNRTTKKHKCLNCNNLIPLYKKYCNRNCYNHHHNTYIICLNCGVEKKVPNNKKEDKYCSIKCANQNINRKETRIKAKKTLENKYGISNPFEIKGYDKLNIDVKKRNKNIKNTWNKKTLDEIEKIGNKISKSYKNKSLEEKTLIKQKQQQTNLKLYNDVSTLGINSTKRKDFEKKQKNNFLKIINTWLSDNNLELMDIYKGVKDINGNIIYYKLRHTVTNTIFYDHFACGRRPKYREYNQYKTSQPEIDITNYIKNIIPNYDILNNVRNLIQGAEIDIYIPVLKVAIEYHGLKWHSELNGKGKEYHLYKTEECEKLGIHLIQIFSDEWNYKQEIIKSKILNILGKIQNKIYARKCEIKEIDSKICNNFLETTHIQGRCKSKIKLGLFYNNELVSVMTFGSLRKITGLKHIENHYELLRYSSNLNICVVGGFSKLLKYFIKTYKPSRIISYADRRYSLGKVYEKNGFIFESNTPPNYWYMKHFNYREHRFKYRKSELGKILNPFNPNISEWENMKQNKYDRIWDCGSKKYSFHIF